MDWLNPVEWFSWLYGKWFQGQSLLGFGAVSAIVLLGLGVLWSRGVDRYREQHPADAAIRDISEVKTRLLLKFSGKSETPEELSSENIDSWYVAWSPKLFAEATNTETKETVPIATTDMNWYVFISFKTQVNYRQMIPTFSDPNALKSAKAMAQNSRYAIINVTGDIPPGTLEISATSNESRQ